LTNDVLHTAREARLANSAYELTDDETEVTDGN